MKYITVHSQINTSLYDLYYNRGKNIFINILKYQYFGLMIDSYKFFKYTLVRWINNYDELKNNGKLYTSFHRKIIKTKII